MQRTALLKKLLPGFIPLFVFIVIDEIWGTRAGLYAAIIIGLLELVWIYFREKRIDRFVIFDTFLLVALGAVSILLDNDLFFKLKPGLIGLILCAILGVSVFSKVNIVGAMAKRYMKDMPVSDSQMAQLRKSMQLMFYVFSAHTLLVFYASFYLSDAAWAFISGGLFYIVFGLVFLYEWIRQKREHKMLNEEEWLPLVDEAGTVIGKAPRSVCHNGEKLLHPVVHLHVFKNKDAVFLQKRPMDKLVQPGKWDTAVGGHIAFGEELETSLTREAWEEIGLKDFSAKLVARYVWETEIEKELVYTFVTNDYQSINIHSDEVEEGRFWTRSQIRKSMGKAVFTPNLEHEFSKLFRF